MSEEINRKRKTSSFSLSDDTFERLDQLSDYYEEKFGVRMSRSSVVEMATKNLFDEFLEEEDNKSKE